MARKQDIKSEHENGNYIKYYRATCFIDGKIQVFHEVYIFIKYLSYTILRNHLRSNCYVPLHSLGGTHSLVASSMTVPKGHSHPLIMQIRGQAIGPILLHV